MNLYIFDTDVLSHQAMMHPAVMRNTFFHLGYELATTTITVDEMVSGWFTQLRRAKTPERVALAHRRLADLIRLLGTWDIVPFTEPAIARYHALERLKLNIDGNDLRIAAIALELGATLVTGNVQHYSRVPGLRFEDWTA